jgi:hypothetical protein
VGGRGGAQGAGVSRVASADRQTVPPSLPREEAERSCQRGGGGGGGGRAGRAGGMPHCRAELPPPQQQPLAPPTAGSANAPSRPEVSAVGMTLRRPLLAPQVLNRSPMRVSSATFCTGRAARGDQHGVRRAPGGPAGEQWRRAWPCAQFDAQAPHLRLHAPRPGRPMAPPPSLATNLASQTPRQPVPPCHHHPTPTHTAAAWGARRSAPASCGRCGPRTRRPQTAPPRWSRTAACTPEGSPAARTSGAWGAGSTARLHTGRGGAGRRAWVGASWGGGRPRPRPGSELRGPRERGRPGLPSHRMGHGERGARSCRADSRDRF